MTEKTATKTPAAKLADPKASAEKQVAIETQSKEEIYIRLGEWIKEKTGKRVGKTGGREIFDKVVEEIFSAATKNETFRFNAGFGSLHTRTYAAGARRLPSGQETTFGERQKLRYEEGVVVEEMVKNGGDLAKALTTRGTRGSSSEASPETGKATAATETSAKTKGEAIVELD